MWLFITAIVLLMLIPFANDFNYKTKNQMKEQTDWKTEKQNAIDRFKEYCKGDFLNRLHAVNFQYNRDRWEATDSLGKVVIEHEQIGQPKILVYVIAAAAHEYPLSVHEYKELKQLFFG